MLPNFPPFSFFKDNKKTGLSYDILKMISAKSGLTFEYVLDDWPNNIKKFKTNKVDIIDGISFKESRVPFTNFTRPYYESALAIYSRKELTHFTGLKSLKGKKLGLIKNIYFKDTITDLDLFHIVEFNNFQDKINALLSGKIDIIFAQSFTISELIKKNKYNNIKLLGELNLKHLKTTDFRFGISKNNTILYSIFNKAYTSISQKQWENLYHKWINIYTRKNNELNLSSMEKEFIRDNKVKCIITKNWAPFNFFIKDKFVGIGADFWNIISKKANIDYSCTYTSNFEAVTQAIKNKTADITLSTAITQDKLKYANFSKPYVSFPIAIATKVNKNFIAKTSFLNNKQVAVGRGYSSYKIISAKYPDIKFIQVKNSDEALKLVSQGKAYAAIDILPVLSYKITENKFNNLKISGTTEFDFDVRFMIRNDYTQLLSIINKSIDIMDENKKNTIGNKWLAVKYNNYIDYSLFWRVFGVCSFLFLIMFYKHYLLKSQNKKLMITKQKLEVTQKELTTLNCLLEQRVIDEVERNRCTDIKMLQQSRLAQLGEMISMIAHQWRQPLNAISATVMNVQLKLEYNKYNLSDKNNTKDFLAFLNQKLIDIETFTLTLTSTIEDFRNFYKSNKKKELVPVNKPVQMAVNIIKTSIESKHIKLIVKHNSNQKIEIYKNELMQVLLNILKNSLDQIISQNISEPYIHINTTCIGNLTKIEIYDNAGGIQKHILNKIFDPYFTTKDEHNGSGLGLYMSKVIIEDHHKGQLQIRNKGEGIHVKILIPHTT